MGKFIEFKKLLKQIEIYLKFFSLRFDCNDVEAPSEGDDEEENGNFSEDEGGEFMKYTFVKWFGN